MKSVLIIGSGISSLTAAIDLADKGIKVFIVENNAYIGGTSLRLNKTFDNNQAAICEVTNLTQRARNHKNIKIFTLSELKSLQNNEGVFTAKVYQEASRVKDECTLCDKCAEVCPIKPFNEFNEGLSLRTAIDTQCPYLPDGYHIEKETPACVDACPVHIDIRKYVGYIASGNYLEALAVVREKNPLPAICGRVCNHPCEDACNRGKYDEPIAIDALKRFAADYESKLIKEGKILPTPIKSPGIKDKVAIIGAGPAGLTVAHDLALKGYRPTIFERSPVPGECFGLGYLNTGCQGILLSRKLIILRGLGLILFIIIL